MCWKTIWRVKSRTLRLQKKKTPENEGKTRNVEGARMKQHIIIWAQRPPNVTAALAYHPRVHHTQCRNEHTAQIPLSTSTPPNFNFEMRFGHRRRKELRDGRSLYLDTKFIRILARIEGFRVTFNFLALLSYGVFYREDTGPRRGLVMRKAEA